MRSPFPGGPVPGIDRGAAGHREVRLESLELGGRLVLVPGLPSSLTTRSLHRIRLESAPVEQDRGGMEQVAGDLGNEAGELLAGLDVLEAAPQEAGEVLAHHRIGCVGQAEFLETASARFLGQFVGLGEREKPVEDHRFEGGPIQLGRHRFGEEAGTARRESRWGPRRDRPWKRGSPWRCGIPGSGRASARNRSWSPLRPAWPAG